MCQSNQYNYALSPLGDKNRYVWFGLIKNDVGVAREVEAQ